MSEERQEVILLATSDIGVADGSSVASSCSQASNTGVLTKLLTGSNTSGTSASNTFILYIPAFRKIEPKPGLELKADGELEEKELIEKDAKSSAGRFLAINATKRGVKTCPVCLKKIGYRAKQCKHCSPSKIRNPRKPRLHHLKPSNPVGATCSISGTKRVELLGHHVPCGSIEATQGDQQSSEQGVQDVVQADLVSSGEANQPQAIVIAEGGAQQLDTMVSPQGNQHQLNSHGFEESLIRTQGDQQQLDTDKTQGDQQQLDADKTQEDQQMLDGASQENHQEILVPLQSAQVLDSIKPQETQTKLGASVGNILDRQGREPMVLEGGMVSNVTEISTSGDSTEKIDVETSQAENQEVINSVFISTKITETFDSETPSNNPTGRYSLQDLICGLLAQNQGVNVDSNQTEVKENEEHITSSTCVDLQMESVQSQSSEETDSRSSNLNESVSEEKTATLSDTPSYDANSVALFLGEMAQRNNGKKRRVSLSKTTDTETKVVALIPGANQKCIVLSGNEPKAAKFRKIQPKDIANVQEEVTVCEEEKETNKEASSEMKGDSQFRIMNGNATRRGVMLCAKCSKMIGCRSKICKHCKNNVTETPTRQASSKTVVKQAVKLFLPAELGIQMFSVRKCKTGPELRCFVQFDDNSNNEASTANTTSTYSCDYPLCVTAKELGDKISGYMCEHSKVCCSPANVLKARLPKLDPERLSTMPYSIDMKKSVQTLHSQCISKGIVLVQSISCRTLAVVEHMNADSSDPWQADTISFTHVRFENIKGQGCFQRQVFCSGRSCMAWNFLSNDTHAAIIKPCSCVHYAAALWAIASDTSLQKDLGEYLDAFVSQAKNENS